jgi:DNA-binding SARP family transcriptional activator
LWGSTPPNDPGGALRTNLYGLRKALGISGRLQTVRNTYTLNLHEDDVLDLHLFQQLTERARDVQLAGDAGEAAMLLDRALDNWGDPLLADVPVTPPLHPVTLALLEQRLAAQESLMDARLALGQHHDLLPSLMSLASEEPLRERRWEQLMLGLYRCGRQAEALDAFTQARAVLAKERGIDPGASLRSLQRLILTGAPAPNVMPRVPQQSWDVSANPRPRRVTIRQQPVSVPHQLPAGPRHFTGREAEQRSLIELTDKVSPRGSSAVVSVLCGVPGIGKTALALHIAHQVADRFPDGQLYVDLDALSSKPAPASSQQAIRSLLDPWVTLPQGNNMTPDAEANLYRTILAKRRMLILVDNADNSAQLAPLIPAAPQCMVIVTSRHTLTGLVISHGAHLMTLDVLSLAESNNLLKSRLTETRLAVDNAALTDISESCARLPLALATAAARAVARPMISLGDLAREVRGQQEKLCAFRGTQSPERIRLALSWCYAVQKAGEPPANAGGTPLAEEAAKLSLRPTASRSGCLTWRANAARVDASNTWPHTK